MSKPDSERLVAGWIQNPMFRASSRCARARINQQQFWLGD